MPAKETGKYFALVVTLLSSYAGFSFAQQNESLLNFKFNHLTNIQRANVHSSTQSLVQSNELEFSQYDATWTYPWETKSVNFDLGVTLRHLSGVNNSITNVGSRYFQQVLPLVHASALFSLPLKGLSAGIEGSHLDANSKQIFDYRAKVSYEWRKGFGLQGGWQHQQFNLDRAAVIGRDYEKNGPFLNFYLNF